MKGKPLKIYIFYTFYVHFSIYILYMNVSIFKVEQNVVRLLLQWIYWSEVKSFSFHFMIFCVILFCWKSVIRKFCAVTFVSKNIFFFNFNYWKGFSGINSVFFDTFSISFFILKEGKKVGGLVLKGGFTRKP